MNKEPTTPKEYQHRTGCTWSEALEAFELEVSEECHSRPTETSEPSANMDRVEIERKNCFAIMDKLRRESDAKIKEAEQDK